MSDKEITVVTVAVFSIPDNPWLGKLIADNGESLLVLDPQGITREVPVYECEILD